MHMFNWHVKTATTYPWMGGIICLFFERELLFYFTLFVVVTKCVHMFNWQVKTATTFPQMGGIICLFFEREFFFFYFILFVVVTK